MADENVPVESKPIEAERVSQATVDAEKAKRMQEEENDLVESLLAIRKMMLDSRGNKPKIDALVLCAILEDSQAPAVVYHGEEVKYTALAVAAATELRNRVIRKISGTL